jgi:mycoredoxin
MVVVYWRPGCPYCAHLRWGLRRMNVASEELNIWSDASAAAFVRSVNGGDETVPTVLVGATTMHNPTPRQVGREIERQSPSLGAK